MMASSTSRISRLWTVLLVVVDVAPGDRGLVEMPDERLVLQRQVAEGVGVQLHDRRFVDPLEQVFAIGRAAVAAGGGLPEVEGRAKSHATAPPPLPQAMVPITVITARILFVMVSLSVAYPVRPSQAVRTDGLEHASAVQDASCRGTPFRASRSAARPSRGTSRRGPASRARPRCAPRSASSATGSPWTRYVIDGGTHEPGQPPHDLGGVGVRRHPVEALDARGHRHQLTLNLDVLGAVQQLAPACPFRLVPDEQHRVVRVRQPGQEMMQHAAAGRHAARGDDDRRRGRGRPTPTDSCADATTVMREVPNTATSRSVGSMPGSSSFTRSA